MSTVVRVLLISLLQLGCYSQHIRHERTRYMSGKDQIFASSYYPRTDTRHYAPAVRHWERPMQLLESSIAIPKTYSSRPLFSWDAIPPTTATAEPNRFESHISPTISSIVKYPYYVNTKSNNVVDDVPPYEIRRVVKPYQKSYNPRVTPPPKKKSGSISYRNSYVYNSNRSSSASQQWEDRSNRTHHGYRRWKICKYGNEYSCRRIKYYGRGFRKGVDSKLHHSKKGFNDENNEIKPFTTTVHRRNYHSLATNDIGSGERWRKGWISSAERTTVPYSKSVSNELSTRIKVLENTTQADSLCESKLEKCDHFCFEENGRAICKCYNGFTLNGSRCLDINECEIDNGGCDGSCINTLGSRICTCAKGFRLSSTDGRCLDVNECLPRNGHGPCQDQCTNTYGSFYCSCGSLPGTKLSANKLSCESVDECTSGSAGCSHSCINMLGRSFCTCPDGFELGNDWKTCHDIDECASPEDHNVDCDFGCINTMGSYRCKSDEKISV